MTEQEAIKALRLEGGLEIKGNLPRTIEFFKGMEETISALEEIQRYRAIGTVEECREAREKLRAMKPMEVSPCKTISFYKCPVCGEILSIGKDFCCKCGQALDWEKKQEVG